MATRVLIRCDGGKVRELGTGHVARCLAIAGDLKRSGAAPLFLMSSAGDEARVLVERVRSAGFEVAEKREESSEQENLLKVASDHQTEVVFLDNLGQSGSSISALQRAGFVVVSMDDPDNPARSDLSINPAFWGCGASVEGFGFTILTALAGEAPGSQVPHPLRSGVIASFGGYDPGGFAELFIGAWAFLQTEETGILAVSSSHANLATLREAAKEHEGLTLLTDAPLLDLFPTAALAVCNGGTTMLMAAALGAPTLAVSQYDHQRDSAVRLASLGGARFLGGAGEVSSESLAHGMANILKDKGLQASLSHGGRCALPGQGRQSVVQRVRFFETLPWDSEFFGFGIATLHGGFLTRRILNLALRHAEKEQIACLYFLASDKDQETFALADGNGFRWVDERLTFSLSQVASRMGAGASEAPGIRKAQLADLPFLGETAGNAYEFSRYFFDGNFPRELCQNFYRDWIQKSVTGEFDDIVFVAEVAGEVAGYVSCRKASSNLGQIGLVGIAEGFRGQGLGAQLIQRALQWFEEEDLPRVEVVTQGRNLPAQKLYRAAGFVLEKSERWYHKWFPEHHTPSMDSEQPSE
jgi:dTDP-4-amino-4,6-dideoxy-D-galactose acyltransferase